MVANQEDDEKLREVKAVLQSLSQIGAGRLPAAGAPSGTGRNATALQALTDRRNVPGRPAGSGQGPREASGKSPSHRKRLGAFALATIAVGTVLVLATDLFFKYWPVPSAGNSTTAGRAVSSSPPAVAAVPAQAVTSASVTSAGTGQPVAPPPAAVPATPPSPAVASAKRLMDAGKITAARALLQHQSLASSRDAAWLLARSYDPNYLASVKSPDATGDKEKAAEWYRRWRDIGAQNGVTMDDVRLKRLIETLD